MAPLKSNYPIGQYLLQLVHSSGLSPEEFFLQVLRYRDEQEGLNDFTRAIGHGLCSAELLKGIRRHSTSLPNFESVYRKNIRFLQREREQAIAAEVDREQRNFAPHICADYESIGPSLRRVSDPFEGLPTPTIQIPPEISKLPVNQQIPLLKPLIQEHYAIYGHIIEGNERIDGYRGWLSLADWNQVNFQLFDIEGTHIPDEPSPIPKPMPPRRGLSKNRKDCSASQNKQISGARR